MLFTVLGIGLVVVLLIAALPLPRVRQAILAFAARAGQTAVLAAVATCGTFFVRSDAVPPTLAPYAGKVALEVHQLMPKVLDSFPSAVWLVVAAAIVATTLPLLALLEFAARVMGQTAMIQALRKELRNAADAIDGRLARLADPPAKELTTELAAAADAMRVAAGEPRKDRPAAPKLVRDLL